MTTPRSFFPSSTAATRRSADLWLAWLDAADDAYEAYVMFKQADSAERADTFIVYRASLDREEAAARMLELDVRSGPAPWS